MQETNHQQTGLWKAARVLAVLLLIGSIISVLFLGFTFVMAFFMGGSIITDGSGLTQLFLVANETGDRMIDAATFGYAGMPAFGAAVMFFVYCCVLVSFLRKCKKMGAFFPGGPVYSNVLITFAALSMTLPPLLFHLFSDNVAQSGYFEMQQPSIIPGCVLTVLTVVAAVLYQKRASQQKTEGETEA